MTIIAAADGSALGNPGPAGWGWYVDDDCWASGGWPHGTNNMGELMAVLDLLEQTAASEDDLLVYCDSTYVINSVTKWMAGWKRNGWVKRDKKPVSNVELMKGIDAAMQGRRVRFEWVKGHAGHPLNEEADRLANSAALAYQAGDEPDPGPGFPGAPAERPAPEAPTPPEPEDEPDLLAMLEEYDDPLADPATSDADRVVALERSLLTDEVRGDPAAVAALLHPDWCEISRSGRHWSRADLLAEVGPLPGGVDLEVISVDPVGADVMLLVWRASSTDPDQVSTLRSSLWVRSGETWLQRFHQGTPEA